MSLSYLIGQSTKFVWYSTHYLISFKYATPIKIDRQNPPPFFKKMPSGKKLFYEMLKLFDSSLKISKEKIPVFKPFIQNLEINAAKISLEDGWLGMGKSVKLFEELIEKKLILEK